MLYTKLWAYVAGVFNNPKQSCFLWLYRLLELPTTVRKMQWPMPVFLALGRQRQKDCQEFEDIVEPGIHSKLKGSLSYGLETPQPNC